MALSHCENQNSFHSVSEYLLILSVCTPHIKTKEVPILTLLPFPWVLSFMRERSSESKSRRVSPLATASCLEDGRGLLSGWKEPEVVREEAPGESRLQMPFSHALGMFALKAYEGWHCPGGTQNGRSVHFTQTDKWSHGESPWSSLSLNPDGWVSHQMLPFCHLPETPLLFISVHPERLCPSAHLQGDYKSNWFHEPQMKITVVIL